MRGCDRTLWLLACLGASSGCRESLRRVEIADPKANWEGAGFAELVPAIRLPTSLDAMDHITIWLRVPDGERIGVQRAAGRSTLIYPPGTIADRIELREPVGTAAEHGKGHGWAVIDVRGTRIGDDGAQYFHCLQPTGPSNALAGFEWPRGDERAERAAADGLAAIAVSGRLADVPHVKRTPILKRLRQLNRCQPCHEPGRAARARAADGAPRRATDGAGFYGVLDALADVGPLEEHRPRDLNGEDPFITVSCGTAAVPARSRNGRFACLDGSVPSARFDLPRALAAGQPHALAVCRSRRYLFDHMDDAARMLFSAAFAGCGIRL